MVDDRLITTVATARADIVSRALTAFYAVAMAVLALAIRVVVLAGRTLIHTEWAVLDVATAVAVPWTWATARHLTFGVALHALALTVRALEESFSVVA